MSSMYRELLKDRRKGNVVGSVEPDKDTSLTLTTVGKKKAEQMTMEEPLSNILLALLEDSVMTIGELAKGTNLSHSAVVVHVKRLHKMGYIKKAGTGGMGNV